MSEANKEVVRRYQEAYNTNNLDVLDEVLAPDWTSNGWPEGVPQTIEGAKDLYQMVRIADGKIVEHWAYADDSGFWEQVGVEVPELMRAMPHRSPTLPTD